MSSIVGFIIKFVAIIFIVRTDIALIAQEDFNKATGLFLQARQSESVEEKIDLLRQAIEAAPSYAEPHLELGKTLIELSNFKEANKQLSMYSALRPMDAVGLYYRGIVSIELGDIKKALEYLELSIGYNPQNWNTYNKLGEVFLNQNKTPEAKKYFQKSLEIKANNKVALFGLGRVYSYSDEIPEAIDAIQAALKIDPNFVEARTKLAELGKLKKTTDTSKKEREKNKKKKVEQDSLSKYIATAKVALRENNLKKALDILNKVSSIQADSEILNYVQLLNQGITNLSITQWDSAHFYFNEALSQFPKDTLALSGKHYALARFAMDSEDFQSAIRELEKVTNLDKQFIDTNELLVDLQKAIVSITPFSYQNAILVGIMIFSISTGFIIFRKNLAIKEKIKIGLKTVINSKAIESTLTLLENSKLTISKWTQLGESPVERNDANRYKILGELGVGGMGRVFRAWDRVLQRVVCLKTIRYETSIETQYKSNLEKRFLQEARATAKLNHPNIITIYDIRKIGDAINISMEYLDTQNLAATIEQEGAVKYKRAGKIVLQVCHGLEFAHKHGIIHRDIKPSNIMLLENDQIKILDFGLAKLFNSTLTQAGEVLGTPSYMSPEQIKGLTVDHRTDIFCLGIVFYELVTGQRPFRAETVEAVTAQILSIEPKTPSLLHSNVPKKIDRIIKKMLVKDVKNRYQKCDQIINDLESIST